MVWRERAKLMPRPWFPLEIKSAHGGLLATHAGYGLHAPRGGKGYRDIFVCDSGHRLGIGAHRAGPKNYAVIVIARVHLPYALKGNPMHFFVKANLMAALGLALAGAPISAATIFSTTLSGANETPPTTSTGTGSMLVTLLADTLTVSVNFSGLSSPDTASHIHCCGVGVSEPIAVPFTTFPTGLTAGTFNDSYDLTNIATYNSAFVTANGGTAATAEAAFIAGLNGGQTYGNVHTVANPGGEIRGQLAAIPEPASVFFAGGFLLVFALFRRKVAS
jgi:hypothetical protein